MRRIYLYLFSLLCFCRMPAQSPQTYPALVIGGKEQAEQVLSTQLSLPKILLNSHFNTSVELHFDLDSAGQAINVQTRPGLNHVLRDESIRMLKFMRFRRNMSEQEARPYEFSYAISTSRYNHFRKQKSKPFLNKRLPADSSFVIYSRADRSPEYYKNGEEGLNEFILSEIDYPRLAIEKSVEGTVVVEFIVETNGFVTGITLKQPLGAGCSEEAVRLISATRWQPAVLNNKLVRYRTTYPITFTLRNVNRDASSTIGH